MDHSYAGRHIRALLLAKSCVELGARIRTVATVTGLSHTELTRIFFQDRPPPRGRMPDSFDWYHNANLFEKVEASVFAAILGRIGADCAGQGEALVCAYRMYAGIFASPPRISFDRAFDLASNLKGQWLRPRPSLALYPCARCDCVHLAAIGDRRIDDRGCIFCRLVKRYRNDSRVRAMFPTRAAPRIRMPPDMSSAGAGAGAGAGDDADIDADPDPEIA